MRLHIMKSVWPPSLVVMRQKRERIQQGVGRAARRGKKMCKRKALTTKCRERLWTWSPRSVLLVAVWSRAGFCISRSSLYASQQTLFYSEKCVKTDLQHPDTHVQMWKRLSMLSKTSSHAYKKCGSAYSWAVSCGAFQDHLIVSCPSIPLLVLVLLILCIFWRWGHSFGNVFAECCALQGSQGFAATVILCFVNLGQPAVFPGTIWWAWRISGSHSAENVSFYSSRILQAPAWHFHTVWKFVCWSSAYTSKGNDPGNIPGPGTSCLPGTAPGVLHLPSLAGALPARVLVGTGWKFAKHHFINFMGWVIVFHLNY